MAHPAKMMKKILIVCALLIANCSFADPGEREVIDFFKGYIMYEPDTMKEMCGVYVRYIFGDPEPKEREVLVTEANDAAYMITVVYDVKKPDADSLHIFVLREDYKRFTNLNGELRLEWLVDMKKNSVIPHNFFARDCIELYEGLLGIGTIVPKEWYLRENR